MELVDVEVNGQAFELEVSDSTTDEQIQQFIAANMDQFQAPQQQEVLSPRARAELSPEQQAGMVSALQAQQAATGQIQQGEQPKPTSVSQTENFLEQLAVENPALAEEIRNTGVGQQALIGAGKLAADIGRGVGALPPITEGEKESFAALKAGTRGGVGAGELAGGAALSLIPGGPIARLPAGLTRTGAAVGAGALEGGVSTRGAGGTPEQIALGTVTGGAFGGVGDALNNLQRSTRAGKELLEPTKGEAKKALAVATPSTSDLKQASSEIYSNVENLGVRISPESFGNLSESIKKSADDLGFDSKVLRATDSGTPESFKVVRRLGDLTGEELTVKNLEQVRRGAQSGAAVASRAANNADANILGNIVDDIDEYLSTLSKKDMTGETVNIGGDLKTARDLWGRARRAEMLDDAVLVARDQASGFENGVRIKFREILRSKKKSRFFSAGEIDAMKSVVQGTRTANLFKKLGKLSFGRGQQSGFLGGSVGAGGGAAAGGAAGGPVGAAVGAVLFPAAGAVSQSLAERLTKNGAAMANQIVRAGRNANDIAKVYLRNTRQDQRSVEELTQILMRQDIDLSTAKIPIAKQAATAADQLRQTAALTPATQQDNDDGI